MRQPLSHDSWHLLRTSLWPRRALRARYLYVATRVAGERKRAAAPSDLRRFAPTLGDLRAASDANEARQSKQDPLNCVRRQNRSSPSPINKLREAARVRRRPPPQHASPQPVRRPTHLSSSAPSAFATTMGASVADAIADPSDGRAAAAVAAASRQRARAIVRVRLLVLRPSDATAHRSGRWICCGRPKLARRIMDTPTTEGD